MHHRIEVIISIGLGITFNCKVNPIRITPTAAILHILANGAHVIIAIWPALLVAEAQTMQQLMHDNEVYGTAGE